MKARFIAILALLTWVCAVSDAQIPGSGCPATDGLGRSLPTYEEVGDIRPDKTVAMFFFTWHSGLSVTSRDYDLTEIITTPDMVNDYDHPNWAPYAGYGGYFFWAEPLFGFYDGKDPWVARKQIEMLGTAGVDVLFFDATNGNFLWKEGYQTLGNALEQADADGVAVPQFAFMLNFGPLDTTAQELGALYEDLYSIGLYEDFWFRWEDKPVVMAYPEAVGTPGNTAGMKFTASQPFTGINAMCPSWANDIGDLTLSLYTWTGSYADATTHPPLARETFVDFADNDKLAVTFTPLPAGDYVWQLSGARETVGVWKYEQETPGIDSFFDGTLVANDYVSEIQVGASWSPLSTGSSFVPVPIGPAAINSQPADTAGLRFTATESFTGIDALCPNWGMPNSDLRLSLYAWAGSYAASVAQTPLASQVFADYANNAYLSMEFFPQPAGEYVWELSDARGSAGVWKFDTETSGIDSYFNGSETTGDYHSRLRTGGNWTALTSGGAMIPVQLQRGYSDATLAAVLDFFTFRPGQGLINTGPTRSDHWGWLENYPQHGYVEKAPGEYEWMTVGIAQNWSETSEILTAMNGGPDIHGRSFTDARQFADLTPDSYVYGYNFQEQWERALAIDPEIIFITGWNEWIAGRYPSWEGVENAFPDQYNPEYSRDIEPARGFTKDHYYYQMIANIRRFKGMPPPETASAARTITINGNFDDWVGVRPRFTDSRGDVLVRDGYGYLDQANPGQYLHYTNNTARNDVVAAQVAQDHTWVYFRVQTAADLTSSSDPNWMLLLIDADRNKATGWEGYEFRVDSYAGDGTARLALSTDAWSWTKVGGIQYSVVGDALELGIPRTLLGLTDEDLVDIEFKWLDTSNPNGDIMAVYTDGEAAPDGRFNYYYKQNPTANTSSFWRSY